MYLPSQPAASGSLCLPRSRRRPVDWTLGLGTRTANALRAFGLHSRAEVEALPLKRLRRIPNLGRASLLDLQRWLKIQPATPPPGLHPGQPHSVVASAWRGF